MFVYIEKNIQEKLQRLFGDDQKKINDFVNYSTKLEADYMNGMDEEFLNRSEIDERQREGRGPQETHS